MFWIISKCGLWEKKCYKLSSSHYFESELETSHRHQEVPACRKASDNFREKKSNKMVKNPDDRLWISVFKWIYWLSHPLTFSKEVRCFQVHFMDIHVSKFVLAKGLHLPSAITLSFSSWKYHYILKIVEFRKLIGKTIYFLSIYISFSMRFSLNFASILNE